MRVIGVKDKLLILGKEDPAKGGVGPAFAVGIDHIHDVQISCCHHIANVLTGSEHLLFTVHGLALAGKLGP